MVISKDSWHYRVYRWNREMLDEPTKSHLNLCPYVRTVFIWSPLMWLFAGRLIPRVYNGLVGLVAGLLVGGYFWYKYDADSFFEILIFAAAIGSLFGILGTFTYYLEHGGKQVISRTSTFQLASAVVESAHSRICPLLEVESKRYPWGPI